MKKLLFALALVSGAAQAQDFGTETRVQAYWQKPFGAENSTAAAPSLGLQFKTGPSTPIQSPFKLAVVDLRFSNQGFQSFSLNGVVLRQNQAPGSAPAVHASHYPKWPDLYLGVCDPYLLAKLARSDNLHALEPAQRKQSGLVT